MISGIDPLALRRARESAGVTQHALARLIGAAGGERVSRWELGTSQPRPEFIAKLAGALGIPALQLIRFEGEAPDLRALRLQAGLSVGELVARANTSVPTYLRWESGRWVRLPSPAVLGAMARALEESVDVVDAGFRAARCLPELQQRLNS